MGKTGERRHDGGSIKAGVRAAIAPLTRASTYRRGVFLVLGGVLLLPYVMLGFVFRMMLTATSTPRPLILLLLAVALIIAAAPLFLASIRTLEIAAVRALLDVDLPEPPGGAPDRETRLRAALWISLHMISGGVIMFGLVSVVPVALVFIWQQLGIGANPLAGQHFGPFDAHNSGWLALIGVITLICVVYAVAGLGSLARLVAPALLGPSQFERIAALEARASQLAERNRLARELHDSVGHALTVATLQASAASELLDSDPEFVRRALSAIGDTSRTAAEDLDYVLGLLRDRESDQLAPPRTLASLERLVADADAMGVPITVEVSGDVGALPAAVSREAYRIIQEGLTNAARHGRGQPTALRLAARTDGASIELVNAAPERARVPAARGGRGLAGMQERVMLLGGRMNVGRQDGEWRMSVDLPVQSPTVRSEEAR